MKSDWMCVGLRFRVSETVCLSVSVSVCVCVREQERERMCACVCGVRERVLMCGGYARVQVGQVRELSVEEKDMLYACSGPSIRKKSGMCACVRVRACVRACV